MMIQKTLPVPVYWVPEFCGRWRIDELSLFGSVLTSEFSSESDIDVLVRFDPKAKWSAFDLLDIQEELERNFGRDVDLVELEAVRNPIRKREILSGRKVLHADE